MSSVAIKLISKLCELRDDELIEQFDFEDKMNKITSMLIERKEEKDYKREFKNCDDLFDETYDIFDSDDETNTDDQILRQYLKDYEKYCVICNKKVTIEELYKFDQRRQDCAYTDWTIGCCCCSGGVKGKDFHKPQSIQFACVGDCYEKLKEYRIEYLARQNYSSSFGKSKMNISDVKLQHIIFKV